MFKQIWILSITRITTAKRLQMTQSYTRSETKRSKSTRFHLCEAIEIGSKSTPKMTVFGKRACGIHTPDGGLSPPKFLRWGFQGGATTAIAVVGSQVSQANIFTIFLAMYCNILLVHTAILINGYSTVTLHNSFSNYSFVLKRRCNHAVQIGLQLWRPIS